MHAQTLPQTSPALSSSRFTWAGSMCDGSSMGISTDSNPHFLNCGKSFVESFVNGDVNRKVLMPNLMVRGFSPAGEKSQLGGAASGPVGFASLLQRVGKRPLPLEQCAAGALGHDHTHESEPHGPRRPGGPRDDDKRQKGHHRAARGDHVVDPHVVAAAVRAVI